MILAKVHMSVVCQYFRRASPLKHLGQFHMHPSSKGGGGCDGVSKLPVPGRPTIWIRVRQGPTALAVGTGGGCLDIFSLVYHFSSFSLSLGYGPI